jgi:dimeric dUTPase (all-alpha-NTP-PPase superfamily)
MIRSQLRIDELCDKMNDLVQTQSSSTDPKIVEQFIAVVMELEAKMKERKDNHFMVLEWTKVVMQFYVNRDVTESRPSISDVLNHMRAAHKVVS